MLTVRQGGQAVTVDSGDVYTMSQLNQNTAGVLERINKHGRPAAITKHGRFVALISPLQDVSVESVVLGAGPIAEQIDNRAAETTAPVSSDDLLDEIADHYGRT